MGDLNPMSSNISLNHQFLPVSNSKVLPGAKISAMSIDGFVGIDRNSVKTFHKQLFNDENAVKDPVRDSKEKNQDFKKNRRTSLAARLLKENLESLASNKSGHSSASEFSEPGDVKSRVSNLVQARFSSSSFTRNSLTRTTQSRNSLSRISRSSLARDTISKSDF